MNGFIDIVAPDMFGMPKAEEAAALAGAPAALCDGAPAGEEPGAAAAGAVAAAAAEDEGPDMARDRQRDAELCSTRLERSL